MSNNIAYGYNALGAVTNGNYNVAIGYNANWFYTIGYVYLELIGCNPCNARANYLTVPELELHCIERGYKKNDVGLFVDDLDLEKNVFNGIILDNTTIDQDCMGIIYKYYTDLNPFKRFDRFAIELNKELSIDKQHYMCLQNAGLYTEGPITKTIKSIKKTVRSIKKTGENVVSFIKHKLKKRPVFMEYL